MVDVTVDMKLMLIPGETLVPGEGGRDMHHIYITGGKGRKGRDGMGREGKGWEGRGRFRITGLLLQWDGLGLCRC